MLKKVSEVVAVLDVPCTLLLLLLPIHYLSSH